MIQQSIQLNGDWFDIIGGEFQKDYMLALNAFLLQEKQAGYAIYPDENNIFSAFNLTQFNDVKIVILGQDPYHGKGQAHGLAFSVQRNIKIPPSLKNIYQEAGINNPQHGDLTHWARAGVLLLNSTLTVRHGVAGSHQNKGWEIFTDKIIHHLNVKQKHLIFMLWGSFAQKKAIFINPEKHLILRAPHPSPLSAYRGFLGCDHFTKANDYLRKHNHPPIIWDHL